MGVFGGESSTFRRVREAASNMVQDTFRRGSDVVYAENLTTIFSSVIGMSNGSGGRALRVGGSFVRHLGGQREEERKRGRCD